MQQNPADLAREIWDILAAIPRQVVSKHDSRYKDYQRYNYQPSPRDEFGGCPKIAEGRKKKKRL